MRKIHYPFHPLYLKNHIRAHRERIPLSQSSLAFHIGISRQSLNKIERSFAVPTLFTALRLANYLQVPVEELFESQWYLFNRE